MKLLAIQGQFGKASDENPVLRQRPSINVDLLTFNQILKPVENILAQDTIYGSMKTDISHHVIELRQMCQDAQAGHTSSDPDVNKGRNRLLNTLQGILESVEKSDGSIVQIDFDDLYALPELTDVIRGDANIYREYMNEEHVANVLCKVASNIDAAQANLWEPLIQIKDDFAQTTDSSSVSLNDDNYDQDISNSVILSSHDDELSNDVA